MRKTLLALFVFATSALAADFTGTWSGEGVTNGESHSLYFILKQDGNTLAGSGGPDASQQHPFKSIKVEGDKIILDIGVGEKGTQIYYFAEFEDAATKGTDVLDTSGVQKQTAQKKDKA